MTRPSLQPIQAKVRFFMHMHQSPLSLGHIILIPGEITSQAFANKDVPSSARSVEETTLGCHGDARGDCRGFLVTPFILPIRHRCTPRSSVRSSLLPCLNFTSHQSPVTLHLEDQDLDLRGVLAGRQCELRVRRAVRVVVCTAHGPPLSFGLPC